ncbi:unnamed protein product, partial [Effrenium voratum]
MSKRQCGTRLPVSDASWTLLIFLLAVFIGGGVQANQSKKPVVAEKHASELDLDCESYEDGVDWSEVRRQLNGFLKEPSAEHPSVSSLLALGRVQTDCYIGLCCLGYMALLFMSPEKRSAALVNTLFGSVPLWDQIPLSYWDTIHSRWPIFGLLEMLGLQVRKEPMASSHRHADGCCDRLDSDLDHVFRQILDNHLSTGASLPIATTTRYLAESSSRCSFGKASAYLALAERLLLADSSILTQAAKDFMAMGEAQLDRCAVGRNVTVFDQMTSEWPFWSILRRVEAEEHVQLPSEKLRTPPQYVSPVLEPPGHLAGRPTRGRWPQDVSGSRPSAAEGSCE